jgi:hypothetical protein
MCDHHESLLAFVPAIDARSPTDVFGWSDVGEEEWNAMPLQRDDRNQDAVSRAEIALTLSHLRAAREALVTIRASGASHALVLEEDADISAIGHWPYRSVRGWIAAAGLPEDALATMVGATAPLQPSDFDKLDTPLVSYTWGGLAEEAIQAGRQVAAWHPGTGVWGTFGILYSRAGLELLMDKFGGGVASALAAPRAPMRFARSSSKFTKEYVADSLIYHTLESSMWVAVPPFVLHNNRLQVAREAKSGSGLRAAGRGAQLGVSSDDVRDRGNAFALQTMRLRWCNATEWSAAKKANNKSMGILLKASQVLCYEK